MVGKEITVTLGVWYQRTTLHLTEIYDFFKFGRSNLDLDKNKLKTFQKNLKLVSVERKLGNLEYVHAITDDGIEIRYYEDGMHTLQKKVKNLDKKEREEVKKYFYTYFKPALDYLFSLGAPTPKVLANIDKVHPLVVCIKKPGAEKINIAKSFGDVYSKSETRDFSVYKTPGTIFIVTKLTSSIDVNKLVEVQIFFREFKDQLQRYLDIHRTVWEEIAEIKDKGKIKGSEMEKYRTRLERYRKSIQLIRNRINQMNSYASTRAKLAAKLNIDKVLVELYTYRFEDLFNSLSYIREIWAMTLDYVDSAIRVLNEASDKAGRSGIKSIQVLASIGVVAGVIGFLSRTELPKITYLGPLYIVGLGFIGLAVDYFLKKRAQNKEYTLQFTEMSDKI